MNKKYLNALLLGALLSGSVGTFVSCKDYDDDISNLQSQIDATNVTLQKLQELINSGSVIKSVTSTGEGLSFLMSDGQTYKVTNGKDGINGTNGKDGVDGVDGKDAVVWTIGEDGYWYQNDEKTEYKAIGIDGKDGKDGTDGKDGKDGVDGTNGTNGTNGVDGKDGKYYVPNQETGFFDIWQDGKLVEATTISWQATGLTAVMNGNVLTIAGVDGSAAPVKITLGAQLGSVAFVPEVMSSEVSYPTTTDEFYNLATYLDEIKYDANGKFIAQSGFDKSNVVEMIYRLNPTDAYVEGAKLAFINRNVTTRAAGDKTSLLNVYSSAFVGDGSVAVNATVNASALATKNAEESIAALQVWAGQNPVTSDYVHVKSNAISLFLVDSVRTAKLTNGNYITFYARNYSITGSKEGENDAFIKKCVPLNYPSNLSFKYDGQINLRERVGLYSASEKAFLTELGFVGMEYEFSLPEKYLANDEQKTNQQWFVTLDPETGILKADATHLTNGLTPAIGRTPVVRVDAFMTDNAGEKKLVASSYIKISIDRNDVEADDKEAVELEMGADKGYEYHALSSAYTQVVAMPWIDVNNSIYGHSGLTSQDFWNYYGGTNKQYTVTITTTAKTGETVKLANEKVNWSNYYLYQANGIYCMVNLNQNAETTANVELSINYFINTENKYQNFKDENGNDLGAKYDVTITIPANDKKAYSDYILTQTFYVKEDCQGFTYNELYYMDSFNGNKGDYVKVKGQLDGTWKMSSYLGEHFEKIDGKDIFSYAPTKKNVRSINFAINDVASAKVAEIVNTPVANTIALKTEMTEPYEVVKVDYTTTLVNGEVCNFSYNVIFINPFVNASTGSTSLYGNGIGTNKTDVAELVVVKDNDGELIYSWVNGALVLSSKAINTYKVTAEPKVSYAFDKDAAYNLLMEQKSNNSTLTVDAETGEVVWENQGTSLVSDHNLTVIATVTFEDLSVVTCEIPVTLTKDNTK